MAAGYARSRTHKKRLLSRWGTLLGFSSRRGELRPIVWVPVVLGLGLVLALADGRAGLRAWWTLRADLSNARERVAALQTEIDELRGHQEALDSDPFAIERAIRQDLELARAGEVVVRIQRASDPSSR